MDSRKRDAGRMEMAELLRQELKAIEGILAIYDAANEMTACQQCERTLNETLLAMLKIRALLLQRTKALDSGVIDDVNFLESNDELNRAFADRQSARDSYLRHKQEDHGLISSDA